MKNLPPCYRCGRQPCECPDGITLYHADCRDVLPLLAPVDLVLTDPPYGIGDAPIKHPEDGGIHENTWHPHADWDHELCTPPLNAPLIAWFGHWRKRRDVEAVYGRCRCEIIWAKDTHVGPPCPAAMQDERLWIFGETFKPLRFETTVWQVSIIPTWAHRHHKNQKPLALMRRAVSWLPGETILDPFTGSGTTLRAAKDLGRRAIGIEIEEKYCKIAAERLRQETLPFGEPNEPSLPEQQTLPAVDAG